MNLVASGLAISLVMSSLVSPPASPDPFRPEPSPPPAALNAPDPFALEKPTTTDANPEPAETEAPTPAVSPSPATTNPPQQTAPPAPVAPPIQSPPLDRGAADRVVGIVLTVLSGGALAAGVGLQLVHFDRVTRCFERRLSDFSGSSELAGLGQCERSERWWRWAAPVFLVGTPILGMTGGGALGRAKAAADGSRGDRRRNTAWSTSLGGALLGIGAAGLVATHTVFLLDDVKNRCAHLGFVECARYNMLVHGGAGDLSVLTLSIGAFMLAYGTAYRRTASSYGLSIYPTLGPGFAGVGIAGRLGR